MRLLALLVALAGALVLPAALGAAPVAALPLTLGAWLACAGLAVLAARPRH